MQVRIGRLDTCECLAQGDRTQGRPHDREPQVHEDPEREKTVQGRDNRRDGNNVLHPYAKQQDSETDSEQQHTALEQVSLCQAASYMLHKRCQRVILLDHHGVFLPEADIYGVLVCRETFRRR
jgi:hypothetical protein